MPQPKQGSIVRALFATATGEAMKRPLVSYNDICVGVSGGGKGADDMGCEQEFLFEEDVDEDPFEYGMETETMKTIDPLCLVVCLTREDLVEARLPWKKAVIVKLLGRKVGLMFLRARLRKLWQPTGSMEMADLENDYFLIRFSKWDDVKRTFEGGHG